MLDTNLSLLDKSGEVMEEIFHLAYDRRDQEAETSGEEKKDRSKDKKDGSCPRYAVVLKPVHHWVQEVGEDHSNGQGPDYRAEDTQKDS